jgi:hypothetical protein
MAPKNGPAETNRPFRGGAERLARTAIDPFEAYRREGRYGEKEGAVCRITLIL